MAKSNGIPILSAVATTLVVGGYSLGAIIPQSSLLGAVLGIFPFLAVVLVLAWRSVHRVLLLALCACAGLALWLWWPRLGGDFGWVYLVRHVGLYSALGIAFGRTLWSGRTPMVSRFAAMAHGYLTPEMGRYCRHVTIAWTMFFAAVVITSLILFVLGPRSWWSVFANVLCFPLLIAMFVVEYAVRRRVLAHVDHVPLLASVRTFREGFGRPANCDGLEGTGPPQRR